MLPPSSSTPHRYCTGTKLPADYGAAARFARECGASEPELREPHRLWALADASRSTQPALTSHVPVPPPAAPVQRVSPLVLACATLLAVVATWRVRSGKQQQQTSLS